jgi:Fe-S-cluster containining protein
MPQPLITNLDLIAQLSKQRDKANWRFRTYVKVDLPHTTEELDAHVHAVAKEVTAKIDCTACANCCRKLNPTVDTEDIARLAKHFRVSVRDFRKEHVFSDEFGEQMVHGAPCPFLVDNKCSIYAVRPKACRDYPYLHNTHFRGRTIALIQNSASCPIAFNTLEELKHSLGYLASRRKPKA